MGAARRTVDCDSHLLIDRRGRTLNKSDVCCICRAFCSSPLIRTGWKAALSPRQLFLRINTFLLFRCGSRRPSPEGADSGNTPRCRLADHRSRGIVRSLRARRSLLSTAFGSPQACHKLRPRVVRRDSARAPTGWLFQRSVCPDWARTGANFGSIRSMAPSGSQLATVSLR
jgi:hypothetical protein